MEAKTIEESSIFSFDTDFSDKQRRTDVHNFFKKYLTKYESDTLSLEDGRRLIRIFFKSGVSKKKRQKQGITTKWGSIEFQDYGSKIKLPEYLSFAL